MRPSCPAVPSKACRHRGRRCCGSSPVVPLPLTGALPVSLCALHPASTSAAAGMTATVKSVLRCGRPRRERRQLPCAWRCAACCATGRLGRARRAARRVKQQRRRSPTDSTRCCRCSTTGSGCKTAPSSSMRRWGPWRTACWPPAQHRPPRPSPPETWPSCWRASAPTATPSGAPRLARVWLARAAAGPRVQQACTATGIRPCCLS